MSHGQWLLITLTAGSDSPYPEAIHDVARTNHGHVVYESSRHEMAEVAVGIGFLASVVAFAVPIAAESALERRSVRPFQSPLRRERRTTS